MVTSPLDEHARALEKAMLGHGDLVFSELAAAVLRVELSREISDTELLAAWDAFKKTSMVEAFKAAMAARLKALGLDK